MLNVTVGVLERAAKSLMDGEEKDMSVKVLLSGGSTTTGAPALTSVAGDVVPLVDENCLFAQVVETGEIAEGVHGKLYVPLKFRLTPVEIQSRGDKQKRNSYMIGGVVVFDKFGREFEAVEVRACEERGGAKRRAGKAHLWIILI